MRAAVPYPTLFGDVSLDVASVSVDGARLPYQHVSRVEQTVALDQTGRDKWDVATLSLTARLPEQELMSGPWADPVCLAVLTEKATNARSTARLVAKAKIFEKRSVAGINTSRGRGGLQVLGRSANRVSVPAIPDLGSR